MLVKMMNVHSAAVTRAILEQLHSDVIDVSSRLLALALKEEGWERHHLSFTPPCSFPKDRFEATQMLKTIGLEKIQAQGLEELTFDLLKRKIHNEPFLVRP